MHKEFKRGARAAAAIASGYNTVSAHPYKLEDCILGKLNLTRRRRPRENKHSADKWLQGLGLALAEVNRLLDAPTAVGEVLRTVGVTIGMLKRAGLDVFDLDELRKCAPRTSE